MSISKTTMAPPMMPQETPRVLLGCGGHRHAPTAAPAAANATPARVTPAVANRMATMRPRTVFVLPTSTLRLRLRYVVSESGSG